MICLGQGGHGKMPMSKWSCLYVVSLGRTPGSYQVVVRICCGDASSICSMSIPRCKISWFSWSPRVSEGWVNPWQPPDPRLGSPTYEVTRISLDHPPWRNGMLSPALPRDVLGATAFDPWVLMTRAGARRQVVPGGARWCQVAIHG